MANQVVNKDALAYCLGELRREDRDRYLTLLFAPKTVRSALVAIYAFNLECARAVAAGGEQPPLGQMRLQWWRDCLTGLGNDPSRQGAHPLLSILAQHTHLALGLQVQLSARERDLTNSAFSTLDEVVAHAAATGGGLAALAALQLDEDQEVPARAAGTAYALAGMLRAIPFQRPCRAFQGRLCLPRNLIEAQGLSEDEIWSGKRMDAIVACVRPVAEAAQLQLDEMTSARGAGMAISPLLHGTLARAYLSRLAKVGYNPYSSKLGLHPLSRPLTMYGRALLRRP